MNVIGMIFVEQDLLQDYRGYLNTLVSQMFIILILGLSDIIELF